jgi:hypothetical protein
MKRFVRVSVSGVAALVIGAGAAGAQQRPLVTEDPESIGAGRVLVEGGYEYGHDQLFPASGLTGNPTRYATFGLSVGFSSIAEIQVDGGAYERLSIVARDPAPASHLLDVSGDSSGSFEDLVFATKVRVAGETPRRPALGVRFGGKVPTASRESGIGLGTSDFFVAALVGKTAQSVRTVGNVGYATLGNPLDGGDRSSALLLGLSVARAVTDRFEVVGEGNGRLHLGGTGAAAGTESRGVLRLAGRYTYRALRLDAGAFLGVTASDPTVGLTFGFTYVFNGFTVP